MNISNIVYTEHVRAELLASPILPPPTKDARQPTWNAKKWNQALASTHNCILGAALMVPDFVPELMSWLCHGQREILDYHRLTGCASMPILFTKVLRTCLLEQPARLGFLGSQRQRGHWFHLSPWTHEALLAARTYEGNTMRNVIQNWRAELHAEEFFWVLVKARL